MAFCHALHGAGPGRGAADEVELRCRWRACQHLRTLWELTNIKGCADDKAAFQLLQKKARLDGDRREDADSDHFIIHSEPIDVADEFAKANE